MPCLSFSMSSSSLATNLFVPMGVGGSMFSSTGEAGVRSNFTSCPRGGVSLEVLDPELDKCGSDPLRKRGVRNNFLSLLYML